MNLDQIINYFQSNSTAPFLLIQPLGTNAAQAPMIYAGQKQNLSIKNTTPSENWLLEGSYSTLLQVTFQQEENIILPRCSLLRNPAIILLPQFPPDIAIGEANIRGYSSNQYGRYYKLTAPVINQYLGI